jgi:predicted transcriptional regulator
MRKKENPRDRITARQLSDNEIAVILRKVGELLKDKRTKVGSLEDVSYEIRISRSALARYERGGDMQLSNFLKVIYGLNIDEEAFFSELRKTFKKDKP